MKGFEILAILILLVSLYPVSRGFDILNIVLLLERNQKNVITSFANALKNIEKVDGSNSIAIADKYVEINREDMNESLNNLCSVYYDGISIVLDFTFFNWEEGLELVFSSKTSYFKVDLSLGPFLAGLDETIKKRGGNDAVLIFQSDQDLEEGLHYIIEKSNLRVLPLNGFSDNVLERVSSLRPTPGYYGILANTKNMRRIYDKVSSSKLFHRPDKWHFVFLDSDFNDFDITAFPENVTLIQPNESRMCSTTHRQGKCYLKDMIELKEKFLEEMLRTFVEIHKINEILPQKLDCANYSGFLDNFEEMDSPNAKFSAELMKNNEFLKVEGEKMSYYLNLSIYKIENSELSTVATWADENLELEADIVLTPAKRFFRVGTAEVRYLPKLSEWKRTVVSIDTNIVTQKRRMSRMQPVKLNGFTSIPWSYIKRDPVTHETILDTDGNPLWEGYCIDLIAQLAVKMAFDYEIVPPRAGTFGKRLTNGTWDGLVGDLVIGETDIAVAALKMTAEREEVIDFVAPYFDQTGISIVIRRPYRQTSLFKFMTVLRLEVWLSIVAALVATALMIWLLDKYSPYSARNNSQAYPYPCRDFSLKESFWFALTSFTPQGGGEVPKSISARTLVAAYWLFVVLMLATFTANLAAFLTVERMQTPVQSLEQLARQSRINYTVVEGSDTHKYFINMKFAEDTLYRLWKELTLNATSDQSQYRIWDYPIKEQYGHILLAINSSVPVKNAAEGFLKVSEHENADFAFIHDSAEIKYEISKNCNLTEIGETFAEQPYAIAVQQGSHLQDELTFAVLELQKERQFEALTAKYWNNSAKRNCDNADENEGITLESLGGVFIATLFGLGLAMVTLVCEVIYYKRSQQSIIKVQPFDQKDSKDKKPLPVEALPSYKDVEKMSKSSASNITLGKEFIPARKRISHIKPREPIRGPFYYE